jgi:hypothetical protein
LSTFAASTTAFANRETLRSLAKSRRRVLKGKQLLPFVDDIDADRIHVQEPYDVVFLCGGKTTDLGDTTIHSLRDAFRKAIPNPPMHHGEWLTAEEVTRSSGFFDSYGDILVFETDIAQIVKLIVLFCESEGSAAELGAFAAIDYILERLFVVVRGKHWNEDSFIKLGPLRRVQNKLGRGAIQVIPDNAVGIATGGMQGIDKKALVELLHEPLMMRLAEENEPTTFNPARAGHVIKLIVGLAQEYGALTFAEISTLLETIRVEKTKKDIKGYLLCARAVGWLSLVPMGPNDYFIATDEGEDAATFHMKESAPEKNKARRRTMIREHWQSKDNTRFAAIRSARSRA